MRNHFLEKTTSHGIAVSDRISLDTMSLQSFHVSVILRRGRTAAQLCLGPSHRKEDQTLRFQIRHSTIIVPPTLPRLKLFGSNPSPPLEPPRAPIVGWLCRSQRLAILYGSGPSDNSEQQADLGSEFRLWSEMLRLTF